MLPECAKLAPCEIAEAENYEFTNVMASFSGLGFNQKLMARVKGLHVSYEVWRMDKLVHSSQSLPAAINSYNEV